MQIKRYFTIALGIISSVVLLAGISAGVKLVQNNQDIRNFAAENSCKKVVGGVTCSWVINNSNDQPYGLNNFYAKVRVEQMINSSWIPLNIGPNTSDYIYVNADNNADAASSTEGSVYIPNILLSADQPYRCKVELVVKNRTIGEKFCGVQTVFSSPGSSCPIGGLSNQILPTSAPLSIPRSIPTTGSVVPTRSPQVQLQTPSKPITNISSCDEAAADCPKLQTGQPGLAISRFERIHQLKKEDLIRSNITSSFSTYQTTVTNPRNNLLCSCTTTVSFPYCKAPRTLTKEDGYPADNCQNGCNFFFIKPGQDTCLSYGESEAKIKLLYSDAGSIDFDDASKNSTFYFNDYDNPIFFNYTYNTPGVFDVTLSCNHLRTGKGSCSKRIVVGNPGTLSPTPQTQKKNQLIPDEVTAPACIENDPAIEVKLKIEKCEGCN